MLMLDLTRGAVGSSCLPGRFAARLLLNLRRNGTWHRLFSILDQRRDCGANLGNAVRQLDLISLI